MTKWTQTAEEYDHARSIMLALLGQPNVLFLMKDGSKIQGAIARTSMGTDVGENVVRGRGPMITKMYGEITVRTAGGEKSFSAIDVRGFEILPHTTN